VNPVDCFGACCVPPARAAKGVGGGVLALVVVFAAAAGVVWVGDTVAVVEAAALTVLTLAVLWVLARVVTRPAAGRQTGTAPAGVRVEPVPVTGDEVRVTATVEDLLGDGDVWPSQRLARIDPAGDLPALPQATTAALEANRVWLREEWTR